MQFIIFLLRNITLIDDVISELILVQKIYTRTLKGFNIEMSGDKVYNFCGINLTLFPINYETLAHGLDYNLYKTIMSKFELI